MTMLTEPYELTLPAGESITCVVTFEAAWQNAAQINDAATGEILFQCSNADQRPRSWSYRNGGATPVIFQVKVGHLPPGTSTWKDNTYTVTSAQGPVGTLITIASDDSSHGVHDKNDCIVKIAFS